MRIAITINDTTYEGEVEPRTLLSDFIRHQAGLTGTHVGCEHGVCGACTVQMDGEPIRACLMLAVQANGRVADHGRGPGRARRRALPAATRVHGHHALQCGFCTAGFLVSADALLRRQPDPSESEIREAIAGNLCRCTGYVGIVDAIRSVAAAAARTGASRVERR